MEVVPQTRNKVAVLVLALADRRARLVAPRRQVVLDVALDRHLLELLPELRLLPVQLRLDPPQLLQVEDAVVHLLDDGERVAVRQRTGDGCRGTGGGSGGRRRGDEARAGEEALTRRDAALALLVVLLVATLLAGAICAARRSRHGRAARLDLEERAGRSARARRDLAERAIEAEGRRAVRVALLGAVDEALHVLRHAVHGVLAAGRAAVVVVAAGAVRALAGRRGAAGTRGRGQLALRSHARVLDGGHDVEVEVVGVGVVGDELRDLDARDEVLVRVRHEVVVLGLRSTRAEAQSPVHKPEEERG